MASSPRSNRLLHACIIAGCLFPVVQACGGRSDTEDYLFADDGTTVGASAGNGGRNSTGGARPVGGNNGRAGSSTAGGTPNPRGGTSAGGSGPVPVAGTSSVGGTGVGGSVGGTGGAPTSCGNQVCDGATQSCCAGLGGLACIDRNQACNGAVLGCTLQSDCSDDEVCCISITGDLDAASSCKARCDNMSSGRDRQLCQVADECRAPFQYCTPTIFGVSVCTRRP